MLLVIIIGLIMGSFFTVVGLRRPNNESIIKPGSHCPGCHHPLKWYDLIPVLSFVFRKGKCAYCKEKISFLYPAIELLTAFLYGISFWHYGFSYEFWAAIILSTLLITIFVSDFKYMIILDGPLLLAAILLFLLKLIYFGWKPALLALASGFLLFALMLIIKLFGDKTFKRESLGGGDIKLAFVIGLTLGIRLGLVSLVLSSFIALPYAMLNIIQKKEREIPFGPFLITSTVIVFFFMAPITNLLSFLY